MDDGVFAPDLGKSTIAIDVDLNGVFMLKKDPGLDASRSLLTRATDDHRPSRRKPKLVVRFRIKHIMYLTLWTAILLAIRQPLENSAPEIVSGMIWASGILAVVLIIVIYGIALTMRDGSSLDKLVVRLLYGLTATLLLFIIFTLLGGPPK